MYKTINGTPYWYESYGEGEPIVLLHGFTGSADTWDNLVHDLQNLYQLITLDLPGHRYMKQGSVKTIEAFCHDLTGLLDQLGLSQVHLIGYSMGGRTALSFAILYPDRVASLILESGSPGLAQETERAARRQQDDRLANYIEQEGLEAFVAYWESLPLFASQKQLSEPVRDKIRAERLSHVPEGLSQSLRYMGTGVQPSWWEALPQLRRPVLLLSGEWDQKFVELNQKMATKLPAVQHKIVYKAGHAIHVEQPVIFAKLASDFLQSRPKSL
ncbi:2-succinyl-6-hydroxy-2,4-cyclohexadiene-1-carboxy late synthase [Barrientosiimonas marina]|uniref:Putative 2-succinyl-6-hydroxy-2,4-cyclohexadiene-1-carboxylate synthase n=1 Tax=Lentibacillus kimchii TaxID=1542911 RepID=A0ABW2USQ4_9BACI